ncbi:MAG: Gfo/Idh/MocA family oxidoreductase [Opitutaceae bacterium]|nr:Gfo/Idh/MocA family oxidoreductase [Opitutaceae bacterium]
MNDKSGVSTLTRRSLLSSSVKLGVVIASAPYVSRAATLGSKGDTLNVALIGCGEQGRVLTNASLPIQGIRFRAVVDIWPYNLGRTERLLKKFGHVAQPFENYAEMLATVEDLDACIVATPDFCHAEHTNAALKAGKHVYCEKLMSNTIEGARSMVTTARKTNRLLQIGHQRRSNPRYLHARDKIVRGSRLLGRVTNISGQWHRGVSEDLGFPKTARIPDDTLARYGYPSMHEFRNWRWFKKYSGGPIADLGAHQIDVYNWMLGTNPQALLASGGIDYYTTHEWYDNAVAIYEFPTPEGIVRATYDVLTTTSAGGGYHEYFMGDEGALKISENPKYTKLYREPRAPDWGRYIAEKIISRTEGNESVRGSGRVDVRETALLAAYDLPVVFQKPIHQPHLDNFFDAIRNSTRLNCPAEEAFATTVTVLGVNEAIAAEKKLRFAPGDFTA